MSYLIEIEQAKSNDQTVKINGIYIHSKYNPIREAEQFIQKVYKENKFYVFLGNGLGYYTAELLKRVSKDQFIVLEPIKEFAQGENVFSFENDLELERILKREIPANQDISIITIPNYEKFFEELQHKIHVIIKDKMTMDQIFNNTVHNQTSLWQENFIRNLAFVKDDYNIHDLKQKYDNPIIIASGGPSLDKQIPLLKKYREKYILIAAGSTITSLMKHQLEPDYVIVMDGKLENFHLFENLQFEKAQLVYSMVTHYKIRDQHPQKCYSYFSSECLGLEEIYEKYTGIDPVHLQGGGSVSSYALSFARYISTGPITFVGQDLAYTKGQSHAQSSIKAREMSDALKRYHGVFETVGYNNQMVETTHQFLAMKHVIENVVEDLEEQGELYNSTEAGLNIIGIPNMTLNDYCEKYLQKTLTLNSSENKLKISASHVQDLLRQEYDNLKTVMAILNETKSLLYIAKSKMKFSNSVNKSLDNNDKQLNQLITQSLVGISAHKIMLTLQKENLKNTSSTPTFEKVYNANMLLVNELTALVEASLETINETLNYLNTESWKKNE